MFRMPVWFHSILGWAVERMMKTPLVSVAQVRMLAEGLGDANPPCPAPPPELAPVITFSEEEIRKGLPKPGPFRLHDLRCCHRGHAAHRHVHEVFFEMP